LRRPGPLNCREGECGCEAGVNRCMKRMLGVRVGNLNDRRLGIAKTLKNISSATPSSPDIPLKLLVRAGKTCLAQVEARAKASPQARLRYSNTRCHGPAL
ncbi:hypothetical protein CRG98_011491, partial [Punica granatum]